MNKAPDNVKQIISSAMLACQKGGLAIVSNEWGLEMDEDEGQFISSVGTVCALGALIVHRNGSIKYDEFRGQKPLSEVEAEEVAAYILGVDTEWVQMFICGFDDELPVGTGLWVHFSEKSRDFEVPRDNEKLMELKSAFLLGKQLAEEFGVNEPLPFDPDDDDSDDDDFEDEEDEEDE